MLATQISVRPVGLKLFCQLPSHSHDRSREQISVPSMFIHQLHPIEEFMSYQYFVCLFIFPAILCGSANAIDISKCSASCRCKSYPPGPRTSFVAPDHAEPPRAGTATVVVRIKNEPDDRLSQLESPIDCRLGRKNFAGTSAKWSAYIQCGPGTRVYLRDSPLDPNS